VTDNLVTPLGRPTDDPATRAAAARWMTRNGYADLLPGPRPRRGAVPGAGAVPVVRQAAARPHHQRWPQAVPAAWVRGRAGSARGEAVIDPTGEMVQLALDIFLATPTESIAQIDAGMARALATVFELVERDYGVRTRPLGACGNACRSFDARCELLAGHSGEHRTFAGAEVRW
jgi:hypothetical protein